MNRFKAVSIYLLISNWQSQFRVLKSTVSDVYTRNWSLRALVSGWKWSRVSANSVATSVTNRLFSACDLVVVKFVDRIEQKLSPQDFIDIHPRLPMFDPKSIKVLRLRMKPPSVSCITYCVYYLFKVPVFIINITVPRKPGSSVSIVSGYGLDDRAIEFRSPVEAKAKYLMTL
jgi:hypothetical protein